MSDSDRIRAAASSARSSIVATSEHDNPLREVAEALDRLGRAISAIDRKLDVLVAGIGADSCAVAVLAASLEGKPKSPAWP